MRPYEIDTPFEINEPFAQFDHSVLRAGMTVRITGTLIAARDAAHARFSQELAEGRPLPFDPAGAIIYYVGPTPPRPGQPIGAAGPTTASRMDPYTPELIERGVRGFIGKGRRSAHVRAAMVHHRCIYFGAVEGHAALLGRTVRQSTIIAFPDLGPEAVRLLDVVSFPAIVVNDLSGNDLYDQGPRSWRGQSTSRLKGSRSGS